MVVISKNCKLINIVSSGLLSASMQSENVTTAR